MVRKYVVQCEFYNIVIPLSGIIIFINYWTRSSKISRFVGGKQINYLPMPKAEANN